MPLPVTVHVAGPVEENGEQRCLGCDLLLLRIPEGTSKLGHRPGSWVASTYDGTTEKFSLTKLRPRRHLREGETMCYQLRTKLRAG